MMILENQCNIFRAFHDGSFEKIIRNKSDIEFLIDIKYLAELVKPSFSFFKCKLKGCRKFEFHIWGEEGRIINDLNSLEKLYLEILNAEVVDNYISIQCATNDESCGGNLIFIAENIIIFDEDGQEISHNELDKLCKLYWDNMNNIK